MLSRWCVCLLVVWSMSGFTGATSKPVPAAGKASANLPVTTSSEEARKSFETAMRAFEEYRIPDTLADLRAATKADPNFAQALILTSRMSPDPAEQAATRKRAKQLAVKDRKSVV